MKLGGTVMRTKLACFFALVMAVAFGAAPTQAQAVKQTIGTNSARARPKSEYAQKQQDSRPYHKQPYVAELGSRDSLTAKSDLPLRKVVQAENAPWLRLHISDYNLGEKSYLTITSLQDGGRQRLDAGTLPQWLNATAFFNGDAVEVELHVAPGEAGVFVRLAELTVGEWVGSQKPATPESLCGDDNRVASTDRRVGRINGCTAWLVSNGALLTAGHCADFDPDDGGPMVPDGILDLAGVVEFNVPASRTDGTPVMANPNDQYPIDRNRVAWRFDGDGQGFGKDWAVFACRPNANTGLLPHQAQGAFFRMTRDAPAEGNTIRVTGCGLDNGTQNRTLQTDTGPYRGESSSGANFWHKYQVDTARASSGSPIIRESNGLAIGIHTNAGCRDDGGGSNAGTSFEHNLLENALQNFPGANTVYVDRGLAVTPRNGAIFQPFSTAANGISAVASGGIVSIVTGSYNETMTITKAMTLIAPVGTVKIGAATSSLSPLETVETHKLR
jgi:hypothetical protein